MAAPATTTPELLEVATPPDPGQVEAAPTPDGYEHRMATPTGEVRDADPVEVATRRIAEVEQQIAEGHDGLKPYLAHLKDKRSRLLGGQSYETRIVPAVEGQVRGGDGATADYNTALVDIPGLSDAERAAIGRMRMPATTGTAAQLAEHTRHAEHLEVSERRGPTASPEYERAFDAYIRRGMAALGHEQQTVLGAGYDPEVRAPMGVGSGAIGGYTVPPGFVVKITDALKQYGGMLQAANVISTDNGQPLQWPTADDTGNSGAILTENSQASEVDITFGTKTLGAYMYTSKLVLVSFQLLQDSAFQLDNWLSKKLGQRIGRAVNNHLTVGTGTAQPTGIQPTLTVGKQGIVGQTATVIYDDLIDTIHSVDPAYRDTASWMMNDATWKFVRKIKDAQGHPIWEPSLQAGMPATLLGYPIRTNQDWPVMAASVRSIGFGDWSQAYTVRRVNDVAVLRLSERYADFLQVGFLAFVRFDGTPDDAAAAKCYQNSAT